MDEARKETVIKEINYWKTHQLLPEHYCDYLLALYTEGEGEKLANKHSTPYYLLIYFFNALLFLFPVLIFQLTDSLFLQIVGVLVVLGISGSFVRLTTRKTYLKEIFSILIFFINFLYSTVIFLNIYIGIDWITIIWIYLNGITWILFGKVKGKFFLQAAGVFVVIIASIFVGFEYF